MRTIYLADHAFVAARAEDLVILDAARGDYLCLPGAAPEAAATEGSNQLTLRDPDLAEALEGLGLTHPDPGPRPRRPPPLAPIDDVLSTPGSRPTPGQVMRMAGAAFEMLTDYWGSPFSVLVDIARAVPFRGFRPPEAALPEARAFRRLLPWIPFQGQCLFRSLMLKSYLRSAGVQATWVVGVQTWPFEAHCWLQQGETVLDDHVDHVRGYTPIMAI